MNDDMSDTATRHLEEATEDHRNLLYHTTWNEEDCVSSAVVCAVAAVSDTEVTALDPLYDVIDPDALDAAISSLDEDAGGYITFTYAGYEVLVRSDGQITLCEHREPGA
jgi:hypothetical protein